MDTTIQDLKFVLRSVARRPGFTAAVLLTLGLGIGANTAIFSVVNGVLLDPLPFEGADRLVTPNVMSTRGFYVSTSFPNFYDWKDQSRSFEAFGAYRGETAVLTGLDRPEVVRTRQVLGDFFEVLGVDAAMGRTISAAESEPGAPAIVTIGHGFWAARLGSDPNIVGRTLTLDDRPFEVIGVMPEGFGFPSSADDIYQPMGYFSEDLNWNVRGSSAGTRAIGRLLPDVSIEQAQTDLSRITQAIRESEDDTAGAPELVFVSDLFVGDVRTPLWILMGAVGFVLLIACANVANLLLARGEGRQRELAVRAAMGAKRNRVVRQLLTESLVLGLAGGVLGVALAWVGVPAMVRSLPDTFPAFLTSRIAIDPTVLGFTFALALATGLIFGFLPAWRSSSPNLVSTLKEGGRAGASKERQGMRSALIVAEVALSLLLLTGAGLLIKSLDELQQVDKGFDETNVLTLNVPLSDSKYPEYDVWQAFQTELLQRVQALPGVEFAATSNILPLGRSGWETSIAPEGVDPFDQDNRSSVLNMFVHTDYFEAMSIPIIRGRGFTPADDMSTPLVAVVDETLADRFWPGENPIGKRVTMEFDPDDVPGISEGDVPEYRTVVGVAKHVRHYQLQEPSRIEIYRPMLQANRQWGFSPFLIAKTASDPTALLQAIREEVTSMDADQPVTQVRTMTDLVDSQVATFSAMRGLLVIFGALALVLAAIGIYGVMSYAVAQRVREIGIRVALGARAGQVRWLMSKQGLRLALVGLVLGSLGSLAVTRGLQSLLFGVAAAEPATMVAVSAILVLVTILATYIPAARATRVDPGTVLREE
jgi:putative ABC transport system permease protein